MSGRIASLAVVVFVTPCLSIRAASTPGQVVGWGDNTLGQATGVPFYGWALPTAYTNAPFATGVVLIANQPLTDAVAIAAGEGHGLALRADGTVAGWGGNSLGQATGVETPAPGRTNGLVSMNGQTLRGVTAIAVGRLFSLALRNSGTITAWGRGEDGGPVKVPAGLSNLVAISAGWRYNLALRSDGTVIDWPVSKIPLPLSNILAIATGPGFYAPSLAMKCDGTLVQWGPNGLLAPVPAGLTNVVAIATGGGHCLALRRNGTVEAWGDNNVGQATGLPPTKAPYYSEGTVAINGRTLTDVAAIAAQSDYSLALKRDGTVVAWGHIAGRPATVPARLNNVVAIAAGENFCLAITTNAAPFAINK